MPELNILEYFTLPDSHITPVFPHLGLASFLRCLTTLTRAVNTWWVPRFTF